MRKLKERIIKRLLKTLGYEDMIVPPRIQISNEPKPLRQYKMARNVFVGDPLLELPEEEQLDKLAKDFSKSLKDQIKENMVIEKDYYRKCYTVSLECWFKP